jgi:hypothetical protein
MFHYDFFYQIKSILNQIEGDENPLRCNTQNKKDLVFIVILFNPIF